MGEARSGWYLLFSAIGIALAIAFWYPRLPPEKRQGWLKLLVTISLGITIPGVVVIGILWLIKKFVLHNA